MIDKTIERDDGGRNQRLVVDTIDGVGEENPTNICVRLFVGPGTATKCAGYLTSAEVTARGAGVSVQFRPGRRTQQWRGSVNEEVAGLFVLTPGNPP